MLSIVPTPVSWKQLSWDDDAHQTQQTQKNSSTGTCLLLWCFTSILLLLADRLNGAWHEGKDFECVEKILVALEFLAAGSVMVSFAVDLSEKYM
jgi:hypothetical protein